jgi:hypothetical protein
METEDKNSSEITSRSSIFKDVVSILLMSKVYNKFCRTLINFSLKVTVLSFLPGVYTSKLN